jgi:molybdate transport system substrate-binding protein
MPLQVRLSLGFLSMLLAAPSLVVAPAAQRPPTIAAAASMNFALTEIAQRFEQDARVPVALVFGASGTFVRQIRDGAPFELFLAADEETPGQLSAAGLTRDTGVVYALGRLAIFAPTGSSLAVDARLDGLARLANEGRIGRFAIANPAVAPYGRAAEAVLRKHRLWDVLRPHLVLGDTITQAAQFATTGNAAGGLIAYSLVVGELGGRGAHAVIPESDYPPLRHRMVLMKGAGPVAARFYAYLQGAAARAILTRHGFAVPE